MSVEITIKGDLHKLHLEPGDALVLKLTSHPDEATLHSIRDEMERMFPGVRVVCLAPDADLEVVGRETPS
jgi:hypothetical protein